MLHAKSKNRAQAFAPFEQQDRAGVRSERPPARAGRPRVRTVGGPTSHTPDQIRPPAPQRRPLGRSTGNERLSIQWDGGFQGFSSPRWRLNHHSSRGWPATSSRRARPDPDSTLTSSLEPRPGKHQLQVKIPSWRNGVPGTFLGHRFAIVFGLSSGHLPDSRTLGRPCLEDMHIPLREGNRYSYCVETHLDLSGDVPIDVPIVVSLDPRTNYKVDR